MVDRVRNELMSSSVSGDLTQFCSHKKPICALFSKLRYTYTPKNIESNIGLAAKYQKGNGLDFL